MKIKLVILVFFLITISCNNLFKDDELNLVKKDFNGNEIRIDGFFYELDTSNSMFLYYFLFNNGLILGKGALSLLEINNSVLINEMTNNMKQYKYNWGLYQIESNKIIFEQWVAGTFPLQVYTYEGDIINDTTFLIKEYYYLKNGQKKNNYQLESTYHFKKFSPKPDSTNSFVP
jgi:hypothetical protein